MSETGGGLGELAGSLYALPLADFTETRNARAKELEDKQLAVDVRRLRKPSLAAWVVNMLVRHEGDQIDQVLELGAALQRAQADLDGDELRLLTRQRRQLTSALTTQARSLSRRLGTTVTQQVADQVEATLTAAMLDTQAARAVRSGLLVTALSATGVDPVELEGAVAFPEAVGERAAAVEALPPTLRVVTDEGAGLREAQAALDAAEEELQQAEQALGAAEHEVSEIGARSLQLQAEIDELRRRIGSLDEELDEVADELEEAEGAREEATTAVTEAREVVAEARAEVARWDG